MQMQIDSLRRDQDWRTVRLARPTGGGLSGGGASIDWGVVRGWTHDDRPVLNVTILNPVSKSGDITSISKATNAVVGVGADHGLKVGDNITFSDIEEGMVEINGEVGEITAVTATTVTVDIDSTSFTDYTTGGTWTLTAVKDWFLPSNSTVEMQCEPGLNANAYEAFKWVGTGAETYPLLLPVGVVPLPILNSGNARVVVHHSSLYHGTVPPGMPVTEGAIVDGQGEVSFAN
jgi:hypothetical protein